MASSFRYLADLEWRGKCEAAQNRFACAPPRLPFHPRVLRRIWPGRVWPSTDGSYTRAPEPRIFGTGYQGRGMYGRKGRFGKRSTDWRECREQLEGFRPAACE